MKKLVLLLVLIVLCLSGCYQYTPQERELIEQVEKELPYCSSSVNPYYSRLKIDLVGYTKQGDPLFKVKYHCGPLGKAWILFSQEGYRMLTLEEVPEGIWRSN